MWNIPEIHRGYPYVFWDIQGDDFKVTKIEVNGEKTRPMGITPKPIGTTLRLIPKSGSGDQSELAEQDKCANRF